MPDPRMSVAEADDLFKLIGELFPPLRDTPERVFRVRVRLLESGLIANSARELLFRHRERFTFFSEPDLYSAVDAETNPAIDAAARRKQVADVFEAKRKADEAERANVEDVWNRTKTWLSKLPPDRLESLKAAAIDRSDEWLKARLMGRSPIDSPVLAALMVGVAKDQSAKGVPA